jgi:hypothetical protein
LFLGTRLQCAKCHNHPFDRWTQQDYYDWANIFSRIRYKIIRNERRDQFDLHEFVGEQVVWLDRSGSVTNPKTGRPAQSRFLDMSDMEPNPGSASAAWTQGARASEEDPLQSLAGWLTSPDNPLFARVQANRVWYHLMGRGLVEPIDDFRPTNPASHPDLLDALTARFIASGFDLRQLLRTVMASRTYQLSSEPNASNRDDTLNYSHAYVRRLSAEQLLDAQCQVLGVPPRFNGYPEGFRAAQIPGVQAVRPRDKRPSPGDQFLKMFGKPERLLTCECERADETTMSQAFQLISGPFINDALAEADNRLTALLGSGKSAEAIVGELYWSALSRPPTEREAAAAVGLLEGNEAERRSGLEDLAWALLNAKEFVLRK